LGLEGVVALVPNMEKISGSHFNIATKGGTRARVGDGNKITWWEQQKIPTHEHL
jgi:hypothetical protein